MSQNSEQQKLYAHLSEEQRLFQRFKELIWSVDQNKEQALLGATKLLQENPALIKVKDKFGKTALHFAACNNALDICKLLVQNGANTDALDNECAAPLSLALFHKSYECTEYLLNFISLNKENDITNYILLLADRDPKLKELCENKKHQEELTKIALFKQLKTAILKNDQSTVSELLKNNPDIINYTDESHQTPLNIAYQHNNANMCYMLLKHEASTNAINTDDYSILRWIIQSNKLNWVLTCLNIAKDISVHINNQDADGNTLLHLSAQKSSWTTCHLLLSHGADANLRNKDGSTPLHLAAQCLDEQSCVTLVNHNAKIDAKDKNGNTPLNIALCNIYFDLAHSLQAISPVDMNNEYVQKCKYSTSQVNMGSINVYKRLIELRKELIARNEPVELENEKVENIIKIISQNDEISLELLSQCFSMDKADLESKDSLPHYISKKIGNNEMMRKLFNEKLGIGKNTKVATRSGHGDEDTEETTPTTAATDATTDTTAMTKATTAAADATTDTTAVTEATTAPWSVDPAQLLDGSFLEELANALSVETLGNAR